MNVQEELLHYPRHRHRQWRGGQEVKVLHKSFYLMGKALSGELSCMWRGHVSSPVQMFRKSYCTTPGIGSFSAVLKFLPSVFYVMGKVSCMWTGLVTSLLKSCQLLKERICFSRKSYIAERNNQEITKVIYCYMEMYSYTLAKVK